MTTDVYGVTEFHARHPEVAYNCAAFAELGQQHDIDDVNVCSKLKLIWKLN